jgi:F420-0:gamma-glutamyl ligase
MKTVKIASRSIPLTTLLDTYLNQFEEKQILAITSKIVALCEGNTIPLDEVDKKQLAVEQSDYYLPSEGKYGFHFTITQNTLIPMAGIDESNSGGCYVLWPKNAQKTCNEIREYLCQRFSIEKAGVIITDSTCQPLRRGTAGICLAHSGFDALNDYVDQPDLFGRSMRVTQSGISSGLAASAVLCMGEGAECTPLAVISDVDFVNFQSRNPSGEELQQLRIPMEDDLFAPFLEAVTWRKGNQAE